MESRIQSQPIVPSEIGATHGSRMSRRTIHLPRKSRASASASTVPRAITRTWATTAKTKVFLSEVWNLMVWTTLTKFLSPTKPRVRLPMLMSLTL